MNDPIRCLPVAGLPANTTPPALTHTEAETLLRWMLFIRALAEKLLLMQRHGRMALFEMMVMNEELERAIVAGDSTARLRERAAAHGMKSLRDAGLFAIFAGATTPEEVVRETLALV